MTALASIIKSGHRKFIAISMASGLALSGTMVWSASNAAFTATTTNPSNNWTTGTVALTDDDSNGAMFDLTGANAIAPGKKGSHCIRVDYDGNMPAAVKLWANTVTNPDAGGTPLGTYIKLTVEQGVLGTFGDCSTFARVGGADGLLFDNTMTAFFAAHGTAAAGVAGGNAEAWAPTLATDFKVFKFSWTTDFDDDGTIDAGDLPDTAAVMNKSLLCNFQWTATST